MVISAILSPANAHLQDAIQRICARLASKVSTGNGLEQAPRLGLYSLMLEYTPMVVYDHPALSRMCDTVFTDGQRVYWHAPFLAQLMQEDRQAQEQKSGEASLLPILLHELTHIALDHVRRTPMVRLTETAANSEGGCLVRRFIISDEDWYFSKLAKEYAVNAIVTSVLRDLRRQARVDRSYLPGKSFQQGVGTREEDCDKYFGLAEPHIEALLRADMLKNYRQSQSGQSQSDLGLDDEIRAEDVARALDAAGLDEVRQQLDIPRADDTQGHENKRRQAQDRVLASNDKMRQIRSTLTSQNAIPGGHLEQTIERSLALESRGKLSWRAALRQAVVGGGLRYGYTEDVLAPEYHLDPADMGLEHSPYDGLLIPSEAADVVGVIVDTSGSMGDGPGLLKELGQEIKGLAEDLARQVRIAIIPADTAVRGEIVELDAMEMEDLNDLSTSGGGGTDFARALNEVVNHFQTHSSSRSKLSHIVYFTDLGDIPPQRGDLPESMPRVTFVTTPECMRQDFAHAVRDWADVVMVEDAREIELSHEESLLALDQPGG